MTEIELKKIVDSGELRKVTYVKDLKNIFNLTDEAFKTMWTYSSSSFDSSPKGTVDVDLQLVYTRDDIEFPVDYANIGLNINENEFEPGKNIDLVKINNIHLYDFE